MEKTNLSKVILGIVTLFAVIFYGMNVLAADDGYEDLTGMLGNNASANNANANTNTNNANTNTNTNTNKVNTNNNTNKTNVNSSSYNNGSIPKTGISDSIPTMLLVVVFGISAVYAYRKISEYKNI